MKTLKKTVLPMALMASLTMLSLQAAAKEQASSLAAQSVQMKCTTSVVNNKKSVVCSFPSNNHGIVIGSTLQGNPVHKVTLSTNGNCGLTQQKSGTTVKGFKVYCANTQGNAVAGNINLVTSSGVVSLKLSSKNNGTVSQHAVIQSTKQAQVVSGKPVIKGYGCKVVDGKTQCQKMKTVTQHVITVY
ncbi:MAG: hypothetical protein KDH94_01760 [Coxiellaceae bacterium]|nr:hypothetical protein [Coxiellaceae bacterium]